MSEKSRKQCLVVQRRYVGENTDFKAIMSEFYDKAYKVRLTVYGESDKALSICPITIEDELSIQLHYVYPRI